MSEVPPKSIRDERTHNLIISEDTDIDETPIAVFLYTPTMSDTNNHFHIPLNQLQVESLHDWLGKYIAQRKK
jgi:hypothetical protein